MVTASSNFNRLVLNAWIGMSRGVAGLPRVIHALGYNGVAIEKMITFFDDTQAKITICPELILSSERVGNTIILEIKSGKNTESGQLSRYAAVTQEVLHRNGGLTPSVLGSFDIVINGDEQHGAFLKVGIEKNNYPFALVVKTTDALKLIHNRLSVEVLHEHLATGLSIDWEVVPMGFIPIDAESELWEVGDVIMPHILALLAQRVPIIHLRDLCSRVCEATWSAIGPKGQNDIINLGYSPR